LSNPYVEEIFSDSEDSVHADCINSFHRVPTRLDIDSISAVILPHDPSSLHMSRRDSNVPANYPPPPSDPDTFVNVVLVAVPTELIAVKHTMMIRASITAYSTAVGPSSHTRKRCTFKASDFIGIPPFQFELHIRKIELESATLLGSVGQNTLSNRSGVGLRFTFWIPV
jgi:hypothetical protein